MLHGRTTKGKSTAQSWWWVTHANSENTPGNIQQHSKLVSIMELEIPFYAQKQTELLIYSLFQGTVVNKTHTVPRSVQTS